MHRWPPRYECSWNDYLHKQLLPFVHLTNIKMHSRIFLWGQIWTEHALKSTDSCWPPSSSLLYLTVLKWMPWCITWLAHAVPQCFSWPKSLKIVLADELVTMWISYSSAMLGNHPLIISSQTQVFWIIISFFLCYYIKYQIIWILFDNTKIQCIQYNSLYKISGESQDKYYKKICH